MVLDRLQREPMLARDARAGSARSVMRCALPFECHAAHDQDCVNDFATAKL